MTYRREPPPHWGKPVPNATREYAHPMKDERCACGAPLFEVLYACAYPWFCDIRLQTPEQQAAHLLYEAVRRERWPWVTERLNLY